MSKFHSTVSRRAFMKGLGLAGAGLGAAAATTPVFHDLDESIGSSKAEWKRPWYVKGRDFLDVTTEIDWNTMQRYDKRNYTGVNPPDATQLLGAQLKKHDQQTAAGEPGFTLRDRALEVSSWLFSGNPLGLKSTFLGPETSGRFGTQFGSMKEWSALPRWQATPEENMRMMRAALIHFGAHEVGAVEINDKTRKLFFSNDGGRDIVFEDVDQAYETSTKRVIPNKYRYVIIYATIQSEELTKRVPTVLGACGWAEAYSLGGIIGPQIQEFLRCIGYQGLGGNPGMMNAYGVLCGVGESSRMSFVVTPEHGALTRETKMLITDLPVAPTKPIDAGIHRFCETCKKCAVNCPSGALSMETDPSWDCVTGVWNNPGIRSWKNDYQKCYRYWLEGSVYGCGTCQGICVYNKKDNAGIHEFIQAAVATTPIFNGFFTTMDDTFGYGLKDEATDSWWKQVRPKDKRYW